MKTKLYTFFLFILLFPNLIPAQQRYTISGYVTDKKSGETLVGASIFDENKSRGTSSNNFGFYSISLPTGDINLSCSYIGYDSFDQTLLLNKDTVINITISENNILEEAVVTANVKNEDLGHKGAQISAIDMPISQLKSVPTLLGERDVIKSLQLLPGVQGGVEGSSGFYVRGGGPDENLFLLDGVPIYNINHLGGFFSAFNGDAIKNVTLYKGGFPSRFGGRTSSIVDIVMKDGNDKELRGVVNVGLISYSINLDGPLFSNKTTFNLSVRRTYLDVLAWPVQEIISSKNPNEEDYYGYNFYDINAKIVHTFSPKDKIFFSAYFGQDKLNTESRSKPDLNNPDEDSNFKNSEYWKWGNFLSALKWSHIFSNKFFMNTTVSYTRYDSYVNSYYFTEFNSINMKREIDLLNKSGVEDISGRINFDYYPHPNHTVKFGTEYTYHTFRPGIEKISNLVVEYNTNYKYDTLVRNDNIYSNEVAFHVEDDFSIGSFFRANVGLRYVNYSVQNKSYNSFQPRATIRLLLTESLSLKAGYSVMQQYVHLLSKGNFSMPTDLWVPVTNMIDPIDSDQYNVGVFYNHKKGYDFSVEAYYKKTDNLLEYKEGISHYENYNKWHEKVVVGGGTSYGVEFFAQKSTGKTTGWISYTWAKSERLFDRPGQELNKGKPYPSKFDKRHDVSIVVAHKLNKKIDFSASWVFSTGQAVSFATHYGKYDPRGVISAGTYDYPIINNKNNFRYPNYHKLDLSVNFRKEKKTGTRVWNVSIYNAYCHMNAFLVHLDAEGIPEYVDGFWVHTSYKMQLKKTTLFPIIPSVSYSWIF